MSIKSTIVKGLMGALEDLAELAVKKEVKAAAKPVAKAAAKKPSLAVKPAAKPAAPAIVKNVSGANKRAVSGAKYDVEAVGKRYPKTAPPELAIDKKTGKEFLQKVNSPEAEAVNKARKAAQADISEGNFTPYFDPSARFYVDPAPYNLQGNTLIDAMPKRADTIAKYEALANDPEGFARLENAYTRGTEHPDAAQWYAMGQLEDAFRQQYGDELGRQLFKARFADAMSATTGGADPTSNLLMAKYANYMKEAGTPLPEKAYDLPSPIGGRYASGNIAMYDRLLGENGAGLTTANPKRFNFSGNFLGDTSRATIDEQMSDLFQPGMMIPPGDSYGVYEKALGDLAGKYSVAPAEFQDVAWAGGKLAKTPNYRPQPMIQTVNEAIERTARVTGLSPEEVVAEGLVGAKRPVYAQGGLVQ
jgi:hypothetical protein